MARTKSVAFPNTRDEFEPLFDKLQRALTTQLLNTSGLAIATAKDNVKTANTIHYTIDSQLYTKAAIADIVLSGTVTANTFNVFVISIDSAGTATATMGTEGASLSAVVFPEIPDGSAVIGFVIVNPTGTGNFVGGTTELDDGTVVPNAVYVNTTYPFLPELSTL